MHFDTVRIPVASNRSGLRVSFAIIKCIIPILGSAIGPRSIRHSGRFGAANAAVKWTTTKWQLDATRGKWHTSMGSDPKNIHLPRFISDAWKND